MKRNAADKAGMLWMPATDIPPEIGHTCRACLSETGVFAGMVSLVDPVNLELVPVACYSRRTGLLDHELWPFPNEPLAKKSATAIAFVERRLIVYGNDSASWYESSVRRSCRPMSSASFPIVAVGKACGTLSVFGQDIGAFTRATLRRLELIAMQVGFAIGHREFRIRAYGREAVC